MVTFRWSELTDISTNFMNSKKIGNCRDEHGQIWIDHFDHENFVILGMVTVKFGLAILP
jgi:hypothetical protein